MSILLFYISLVRDLILEYIRFLLSDYWEIMEEILRPSIMRVAMSSSPNWSENFLIFHITYDSCCDYRGIWLSSFEPTIIRRSLVQQLRVREDFAALLKTKLLLLFTCSSEKHINYIFFTSLDRDIFGITSPLSSYKKLNVKSTQMMIQESPILFLVDFVVIERTGGSCCCCWESGRHFALDV